MKKLFPVISNLENQYLIYGLFKSAICIVAVEYNILVISKCQRCFDTKFSAPINGRLFNYWLEHTD